MVVFLQHLNRWFYLAHLAHKKNKHNLDALTPLDMVRTAAMMILDSNSEERIVQSAARKLMVLNEEGLSPKRKEKETMVKTM